MVVLYSSSPALKLVWLVGPSDVFKLFTTLYSKALPPWVSDKSYVQGTFGPGGVVTDPVDGPFGSAGSQVFPGFTPESAGENTRHNYSFYVDVEADVLENWNVAVAGRYEDYSDFGSTFNWKMSHRVTITDALALRASISTGFRAPSLQQQHFTSIATVFVDGEPTETGTFAASSDVAQALGSPGLDALR